MRPVTFEFISQTITGLLVNHEFQGLLPVEIKHIGDFAYPNLSQQNPTISMQQILVQLAKYGYRYLLHFANVPNQMPVQNTGTAYPLVAKTETKADMIPLALRAAKTPRKTPITMDRICATITSRIVGPMRSAINLDTG